MTKTIFSLFAILLSISVYSTEITDEKERDSDVYEFTISSTGVAVSPSRIRFSAEPGSVKSSKIKINNGTDEAKSFKVKFNDFNMNEHGKSQFVAPGNGKYGVSDWLSVSPSFIEVGPGEKKEITVTIDVPLDEMGHKAAWGIMMLEEASERTTFEPAANGENIAFGIIPTLAFGVYVYQNPPGVTTNKLDIVDFQINQFEGRNLINIKANNKGTGIAYCKAYVELTNLNTGFQDKLLVKTFTIVPELTRSFSFELPENLESGHYSAVGVIDYGSEEEIEAAELEFEIK